MGIYGDGQEKRRDPVSQIKISQFLILIDDLITEQLIQMPRLTLQIFRSVNPEIFINKMLIEHLHKQDATTISVGMQISHMSMS